MSFPILRGSSLRETEVGKKVTVHGWVHSRRDHGGLIFIDLRDFGGLLQVAFHPESHPEVFKLAESIRSEDVIRVTGTLITRPASMVNPKLATGKVELTAEELIIFSKAATPPFEVSADTLSVNEETRLKYRYLDLRSERMRRNIRMRHRVIKFLRDYLDKEGFVEIETPILTKSTPEGARDFLVPSRLHPGSFYALPQSPQQYKQLLMVGGIERYFQIARCFRDEDQRGDRQAEFTQLDMEMSFVGRDDVLMLIEGLFTQLVETLYPEKKIMQKPWPRLTYHEVMEKYGIDKPDIRFGLELTDITELAHASEFKVFKEAKLVKGITAAQSFSRSEMDELEAFAKEEGAKGLASAKVTADGFESQIAKYFSLELQKKIATAMQAKEGDTLMWVADEKFKANEVLAALRNHLGDTLKLRDPNLLAFAFVVDFPLFEEGKLENGHFAPSHHMFTMPKEEDLKLLDTDPAKARSYQYDFVLNGYEVGGGSIRIHDPKIQEKIFSLIGFTEKEKQYFSHMLKAFSYGVPPHGGIAPGIDRLLMILQNEPNIREVIAFPKNQTAQDLMMDAPSWVSEEQLRELSIKVTKRE
ncbi:MAG: aspartate--tRNA ligase [Parcubacteria group bacterium]|nr:aspartate--tRNA ligase [Parcubacteria group bacterium]